MGEGEEKEKKMGSKNEEELQKRLESKVLGMLEDPGTKRAEESGKPPDKTGAKPQDTAVNEEPPASETEKEKTSPPKEDASKEAPPASDEPAPASAEKPAPTAEKEKSPPKEDEDSSKGGEQPQIPGEEEEEVETIDELIAQKEEVNALLSSVEDSYRDATLPDKTYREVKQKNEKKLNEIETKLKELAKTATPEELEKIKSAEETEEAAGEVPAEPAPVEPAPAEPAAPAEETGGGAPAAVTGEQKGRADAVIRLLEQQIEQKLRKVIDTANIEMTDKRLKKLEVRLENIERAARDIKGTADTTSKSVGGYDKQFTVMKTEVEKVKALVDNVKEAEKIMGEKFQRTTESFAEIRSIVYQREAKSKEEEVLIDKLKDTVSQVDSARILREFTTRDEQMKDVNTRLERMERSVKMSSDSINRIKGLMTDIGSLENIVKASKHVGEKLEKIQEIEERMKKSSSKLDGVYVDMKKKIDDFNDYKVKQDKLTGMSEDMMKNVEDLTRRLADYATKDDIKKTGDELKLVREEVKKVTASNLSPEVAGLQEQKEEINTLLSTLEENFKNKEIGEGEYNKAKESNMLKLSEIEKKLAAASSAKGAAGAESSQGGAVDEKHTRVMMIAKLRESYENGEISKTAYDKSRRVLLRKG